MDEVIARLLALEGRVNDLEHKVDILLGQTGTINTLIKWVILPLIVILGGLVGIKIMLPTG